MRYKLISFALLLATTGAGSVAQNESAHPQSSAQQVDAENRRGFAQRLFHSEVFDQAASQFKVIVDQGSAQASDYYWLGEAYYHMDKFTEAANSFKEAIVLDPKMDTAKVRLVEAYLATRNMKEAQNAVTAGLSAVNDAYAKLQLEVMNRLANNSYPPAIPPLKM